MKILQTVFSYILIFVLCVIFSKQIYADNKNIKIKKNVLYIVGSDFGISLNEKKNSNLNTELKKLFQVVNLSKPNIYIYDQLDILEEIPIDANVLILLENFYLESILYETNYQKTLCKNKLNDCKNISYINYIKMYFPLINLLHYRLEQMFLFDAKHNIKFLVIESQKNLMEKDITDSFKSKYVYFNNKKNYCYLKNIELIDNDNIICIINFL